MIVYILSIPLVSFGQGTSGGGNTTGNTGTTGNTNTTGNTGTTGNTPATTQTINVKIENPFNGGDSLMDLLTKILNSVILPIAAVAVTMWIIWAGFQFVLAQGNPGAIDKAKSNLLWSLIGAGILLGAVGISAAVQSTFDALTK